MTTTLKRSHSQTSRKPLSSGSFRANVKASSAPDTQSTPPHVAKRCRTSLNPEHVDLPSTTLYSRATSTTASLHSCPNEIIAHILKLAEMSFDDAFQQQRQRQSHDLVCKNWRSLGAIQRDDYALRGFKQTRRLARIFSTDRMKAMRSRRLIISLLVEHSPASSPLSEEPSSIDDLPKVVCEDRLGSRQMVADLLVRCGPLKVFDLTLLGRDRYSPEAACLMPPLYMALASQKHLTEFGIHFYRSWTALTLGGDLGMTLRNFKKLERLFLPRVLVPKIPPSFLSDFNPALRELSLHIDHLEGSLFLLRHLIQTSSSTLRNLSIMVHNQFPDLKLDSLSTILSPVAGQLKSFSIRSPYTEDMSEDDPRWTCLSALPPLNVLFPLMTSVTSLEISHTLIRDFTLLESLPSLTRITYDTHNEGFARMFDLMAHLSDDGTVKRLTEVEIVCWDRRSYKELTLFPWSKKNESIYKKGISLCFRREIGPSEED